MSYASMLRGTYVLWNGKIFPWGTVHLARKGTEPPPPEFDPEQTLAYAGIALWSEKLRLFAKEEGFRTHIKEDELEILDAQGTVVELILDNNELRTVLEVGARVQEDGGLSQLQQNRALGLGLYVEFGNISPRVDPALRGQTVVLLYVLNAPSHSPCLVFSQQGDAIFCVTQLDPIEATLKDNYVGSFDSAEAAQIHRRLLMGSEMDKGVVYGISATDDEQYLLGWPSKAGAYLRSKEIDFLSDQEK
jgi:hypothetical protein